MYTQQEQEEDDDCCICNESLPKLALNFVRMTCCGKGLHYKCNDAIGLSSMSLEQKNRCPLCRQKRSDSDEKRIKQLRPWVEKGKAWAQCMLGDRYRNGGGNPTNELQSCMN